MQRGSLRFRLAALVASGLAALSLFAQAPTPVQTQDLTGVAILQDLRSFRELGSVLYIAAHPDDENNQLLAYFARGRYYRTAYLSLNRGDGGQNEIGPEFGEELGVIRTQESLAARRVDGARQFFSRAFDFGFSKSFAETLRIWDHQQVLADTVRVIREFRPDVLITRFSPIPGITHGHHTASTMIAQEAFKISDDPKAFPEQIAEGLLPWQPKRILFNVGGGGGQGVADGYSPAVLRMNIGGSDPVSGESFASIAARARANHKTQGFGNLAGGVGAGARTETFQLLDGEPATTDVLDGVDTTWSRYTDGADISKLTDDAIAQFKTEDPSASVTALLAIRAKLAALAKDPVVDEKRAQLDRILQNCLGLTVETTIPNAEVVPGETLVMKHSVKLHASFPVDWVAVRYPRSTIAPVANSFISKSLPVDKELAITGSAKLPADTLLSEPYWLRADHTPGMARVDDDSLIGRPESPPVYSLEYVFNVGNQTLVIPDVPVQVTNDPAKGETRRKLDAISPVAMSFANDVQLFAPGASKPVEVEVTAYRSVTNGSLHLDAPAGWTITPAAQTFKATVGDKVKLTFTITAPAQLTSANVTAQANVNGVTYSNERIVIQYDHIPVQMLQPQARFKAVSLDLAIRGKKVGYLPGAGDSIAAALEQMGYTVTQLTGADLTPEKLRGLDAVVLGVRAFNVRTDLADNVAGLFAYVEQGGTVVAQYNRPDRLSTNQLGPYNLSIAGQAPPLRVTDENAPVQFLAPDHPVMTTPNKITLADFDGWVQERGAYFASSWDEHYIPLFAMSDPGETQPSSSVLVAKYGQGYYVYTSLGFFRQLPAGVPGAYRLFANLVSLGK
ncbi:MAG TPA: PIG-L family deacetylase [Opitutales bacterium]|jgi:LmbE family N-acetylglucosaminyl deacetylase|nr:PIG-L family deacetylase [Opitutales bacterium]